MKKEWWIVGGIGTICITVWTVLLFTVFEEESTPLPSSDAEATASLMDFYGEELQENENFYALDEEALNAESSDNLEIESDLDTNDSNQSEQTAEIESDIPEAAEDLVIDESDIQRIQEDGLQLEDIKKIAPDQSMSIDEILAYLNDLEESTPE